MTKKRIPSYAGLCIPLVFIAGLVPELGGATPAGWDQVPQILARIQAPTFSGRVFDVTAFGAVGDGATDSRGAILKAIQAAADSGGGRVVVPAGNFLSNGPIHLKSNIDLHLAEGCKLLFGTNPDDYLVGDPARGGGVIVRWESTRCYNYSPMIYAHKQRNIAISGRGVLDGQSGKFWSAWKKQQTPGSDRLRDMSRRGVPIDERIFGRGSFLRPSLVELVECEKVLIEGLTLQNSPFWTVHPVFCTNVTIRGLTIRPGNTNDDGCDPDSCTDVLIEGCTFTTNDDNIAIKAGRDRDGWAENGGKPSQNIIIRDCTFLRGRPGGVSIGSEMSGDVRNIFVENCTMKKVDRAFYIKSNPDRGGVVEQIWIRDVTIAETNVLLKMEMNYKGLTKGAHMPTFRKVVLERIQCQSAVNLIDVQGLAASPVRDITIREVTAAANKTPLILAYAEAIQLDRVTANGKSVTRPDGPRP
jgi:polygalacturonase